MMRPSFCVFKNSSKQPPAASTLRSLRTRISISGNRLASTLTSIPPIVEQTTTPTVATPTVATQRVPKHVEAKVNELREKLSRYSQEYYNLPLVSSNRQSSSKSSTPLLTTTTLSVTDAEYDRLFQQLVSLEKQFPELASSSSPTQLVGPSPSTHNAKASHLFPMISLQSIFDWESVINFHETALAEAAMWGGTEEKMEQEKRPKGSSSSFISLSESLRTILLRELRQLGLLRGAKLSKLFYSLELKYDGMAISLIFRNGKFVRAVTRGDGVSGEDVTSNVLKLVPTLPSSLDLSRLATAYPFPDLQRGNFEVRAELIISKEEFHRYNRLFASQEAESEGEELLTDNGKAEEEKLKFPLARSLVVGLLRRENLEELPLPKLSLVCYSLHFPIDLDFASLLQSTSSPAASLDNTLHLLRSLATLDQRNSESDLLTKFFTQQGRIKILSELGFQTDAGITFLGEREIEKVREEMEKWKEVRAANDFSVMEKEEKGGKKSASPLVYEMDGMVLKMNSLPLTWLLSSNARHHKWAIAYKFPAKTAKTTLLDVIYQVGRSGRITPIAILTPATIGGTRITKASLQTIHSIVSMGLKYGDTLEIEKKGDAIPGVIGLCPSIASSKEVSRQGQPIDLPTHCPCARKSEVRKEALKSDSDAFTLVCASEDCSLQQVQRISHFCSGSGINAKGWGVKTIEQLLDLKIISGLADLSRMREKLPTLISLKGQGWGVKKAENVVTEIESALKNATQHQLVCALGIPRVGASTAKKLLATFGSLKNLVDASTAALEEAGIPAAYTKIVHHELQAAKSFLSNFHFDEQKESPESPKQLSSEKAIAFFTGKRVVLTGALPNMTREQAKKLIEAAGGSVSGSMKSADFIILGRTKSQTRKQAAVGGKSDVTVLLPEQFFDIIN